MADVDAPLSAWHTGRYVPGVTFSADTRSNDDAPVNSSTSVWRISAIFFQCLTRAWLCTAVLILWSRITDLDLSAMMVILLHIRLSNYSLYPQQTSPAPLVQYGQPQNLVSASDQSHEGPPYQWPLPSSDEAPATPSDLTYNTL